jgi:carbon monoxide dehydrogenase subunit G
MHFTNEFRVGVPVAQAWAVLTSVERIAPCMPGAELTGVEGDQYQGTIKIKLGPVTAQYQGVASFEALDPAAHRAVLTASGRDTRGQGNARARIVAQLVPDGDVTNVSVGTELTITGKIAQFGRGMITDVSDKLLQRFAANLEAELTATRPARVAAHVDAEPPDPGGGNTM